MTKDRDHAGRYMPEAFSTIDRRWLLRAVGGCALAAPLGFDSSVRADVKIASQPFTLGVAAGEPAADGFVIWTRLAPMPLERHGGMPMNAFDVVWEVADDPAMQRIVAKGTAMARPELGHAVHVEVEGLMPGRPYHYRFRMAGHESRIGRARTLPAVGAAVSTFRFAVAGCQRYDDGHFTNWQHIAAEDLDLVFHYGDYIYEYGNRIARERDRKVARILPGDSDEEIYTLDDYRRRYAIYKLDPDLQQAHAAHAFLPSFDDHEVDSNWASSESEEKGVTRELFALRRAAALQAWYEAMPLRRSAFPRNGGVLAHRRFAIGDLMTLNVLDTRQHRTRQGCGGGWKKRCQDFADPARTMLGTSQENWLLDGMAQAQTRWTSLAQQVVMLQRDRDPAPDSIETHADKWDGAQVARQKILDAAAARPQTGLVVLSGDLHEHIAGALKTDFNTPRSQTLGAEFLAASISSEGDGAANTRAGAALLANNPHVLLHNNQRGYVVNEVGPDQWRARIKVVDKVSVPGAPVQNVADFAYDRRERVLAKA
jgi:alkaline phosphatase D